MCQKHEMAGRLVAARSGEVRARAQHQRRTTVAQYIGLDVSLKDGVVAALPRRHRNVPRRWCLRPLSGKDGNHDRSYNERSRTGKECFPGDRQSVVTGMSVTVREDLGGRLNKKKQKKR